MLVFDLNNYGPLKLYFNVFHGLRFIFLKCSQKIE